MGVDDKPEVVDAVDEIANLFDQLGRHDKKIFDLKAEIAKAERFIKFGVGANDDGSAFEHSLRIDEFKDELAKYEAARKEMAENIDSLESARFGEEIPRDKDGVYQVPWDEIELSNAQVGQVLRDIK